MRRTLWELQVEQQARRVFQRVLHGHEAQHGFSAVDDAVVIRHGQVVHRTHHDLAVFDHGAVLGGVHATKDRAVVENGQVVVRPMNYLAMSYDHRIIDGREAVLGLVAMKDALEDPSRLLFDL